MKIVITKENLYAIFHKICTHTTDSGGYECDELRQHYEHGDFPEEIEIDKLEIKF